MQESFRYLFAVLIVINAFSAIAAENSSCSADAVCRQFEALSEAGEYEKLIAGVDASKEYSEASRVLIGRAYLWLASDETNTPEQEEAFCRKGIEFGAVQGYMGLYFIHVQKDAEKALEYLRQYIAAKPRDPVPYVILGEAALNKKNYGLADEYLRESRKISRAGSPRVAWMLFQANYLLGNYEFAEEMLGNALKNNANFEKELKKLPVDPRFDGIADRPEFKQYGIKK